MREYLDPYRVLGVSPEATQAEITHAYRTRLRAQHPDTRQTPCSHTADDELRRVLAAYTLLRDPARRAEYDRTHARHAEPHLHPAPADRGAVGPVAVPITYHRTDTASGYDPAPPLRAGPVRRHRRR